ncbi:hypothetical protein [Soonwooa sp.]|uniref:hypothetical protein n=1 Tax=Soonwooa sp. TaxID=1938592 RepID=UPI0026292472|nr:hypothetical protein [Soonwooa sp.]
MKQKTFIAALAMSLFLATANKANAQAYLGKSYTPTEKVDMYLNSEDVKKPYEVMGTSSVNQGFKSLEKTQKKVIELGKTKGADGVIMKLTEEVTGTQQSDFGNVNAGKKNNSTFSGSSSTTNIKVKKIEATYIKYKD